MIFPRYSWVDPEGEGVGDLEFPCGECGRIIKRESAYHDDAGGIVCERCKAKYKLCISIYVKKEEAEPEVAGPQNDEQMYGKGGGFTPK